ncbi:MAG: ATP synthase F1 subunit gamma [Acidobacteria bacterium]|nr:ATP synthase F1 subunit gamma [Acidobacteriota bacterium]MCI0629009.1 ATP synthase F1 subunit gamma [Acidobacteriota bacterium]
MPNVLDIRRRIRSVKNTQQITKAMKMVSAAKLRRAQERVVSARPYAQKILSVLNSLVTRSEGQTHPLLEDRGGDRVQLVVITADKGLCGAFNSNIIKAAQNFIGENQHQQLTLNCVGRKGRDFFRKDSVPIAHQLVNVFARLDYSHAKQISGQLMEEFASKELDAVYLVYNEFKSVIQQRIVVEQLLPIQRLAASSKANLIDYIYEQPAGEIFNNLIPKHVEVQVYRALLESAAAEHGARMTAMDAATNNAFDLIDSLTLTMNRARQAGITKEIIEIVGGAAALE